MSISEIVNYVNRTPHNTNPNVIASMVQGANEQAVYESVEELKRSGGVGSSDMWSITWDGNIDGKTVICYKTVLLCKVSSKVLTSSDVIGSAVSVEGKSVTVTKDDILADESGMILLDSCLSAVAGTYFYNDIPIIVPESGTYFSCIEGVFTESITKETIHPIDPKYLPDTVATKADIFGAMEASY